LWEEVAMKKGAELFDAWAKTATDFLEIGMKMQETWKHSLANQIEMGREITKIWA
jgi:hypothetical protein